MKRLMMTHTEFEGYLQQCNSLFEYNPEGIFTADKSGKLRNLNQACVDLLGYSEEEFITMDYKQLVIPKYFEETIRHLSQALKGEPQQYETACKHKAGYVIPLSITIIPIVVQEEVKGVYGIVKDISNEKDAQEKYRSLFNNNLDAVFELDSEGVYTDVNKMAEELTGYSKCEIVGRHFTTLIAEDLEKAKEDFQGVKEGRIAYFEQKLKNKKGEVLEILLSPAPIRKYGKSMGFFAIAKDVTKVRQYERKIQELAYTCQLTGILNRHGFYQELLNLNESPPIGSVAILSVDFDDFKYINDTLGHTAGDLFLVKGSERLKKSIGEKDILSRVGGDEFIIILKDVSKDEVIGMAKRILLETQQPFVIEKHEFIVTVSIGISIDDSHTIDVRTLYQQADLALLSAKQAGKNTYQFFTDDLKKQLLRRPKIENALRNGIARNEFQLLYQPQVDIQTGDLVGLEALLRWKPSFGYVSPAEFIPIAEGTGIILEIGEWVIREACRQIKKWDFYEHPDFKVSVNVSARQFKDPKFASKVKEIIQEEKISPQFFEIEITESIMLDVNGASQTLQELKELGVKIAIDDFGAGYSSLSVIMNVEIDTIKIDKSIIDGIVDGKRNMSLVKAIINVGDMLNTKIVVEGIEEKEQADLLTCYSVIAQGFYFSRPLPTDQVDDLWKQTASAKF